MYYVNREQIERRLDVIPEILQVFTLANTNPGEHLLARYAEERAIHLAIEVVTDVGSYLIDGFIMRDASSYEDIVEIMMDEQVVDKELGNILTKLVRLRRPLVQSYVITSYSIHYTKLYDPLYYEGLETFISKCFNHSDPEH